MRFSLESPVYRPARLRRVAGGTALIATGVLLAACTASGSGSGDGPTGGAAATGGSSGSSSSSAPAQATLAVHLDSQRDVNPTDPISVSVDHGSLTKVTMANESGKQVSAATASNGKSWHTTEVLGYGKTYTIHAAARSESGTPTTKTEKFTTLDPSSTISATIDRMGGYLLDGGQTYGVALIPVVHFDSAVHNKAAAQRALKVTTSKPVQGVWSWVDDTDVAYRPQAYWPANTKVTVAANVYGVNLGHGSYGESDETTSYTVGRKLLTVADDNAPEAVDKVRVYNAAGKVLRTMDTSMGKHGGETLSNGTYINFYTLDGTYTVLAHENPAIMSSQSYGLPQNAPSGYGKLSVPYSTKISTDGIYLHEFNSTQYEQEHGEDVSEGCLNLVTADAKWYFDHTLIGDPVVVHGKKHAPTIEPWEGGYWSIPWSTWTKNSALS